MLDMKRRELLMLWPSTVTEELRNDVRFALRFKVGRKQQPLTDTQRDMVAAAIVEHIRLCPAVCLGELPRNSLGARMRGHAQPQNLTAGMPQNQSSADVGKHRFIFVMEEIRQRHRRVPRSGRCSNCETAGDDARRPPAFRTRTPECPRRL